MTKTGIHNALLVILAFVVYSCTSIFSKSASTHEFLSVPYIFCFGGVLCMMGIYAILWQKILAFLPLNFAFLFKSTTIIIILCISCFIFGESVTVNNIIGTIFIMAGLAVLAWGK